MPDVSALGLRVDSSEVERGTVALKQLSGAADGAEAAARGLAGGTQQAASAAHALSGAAEAEARGLTAATAATNANSRALSVNNAAMRQANAQRTNLIFQLQDIGVSLASGMNPMTVAIQQGSQISTIYGPGGLGKALAETANLAVSFVTKFWPVAVVIGAVMAAFGALTTEINKNGKAQVGVTDVILAAWELLVEKIGALLAPITGWVVDMWNAASPHIANAVEGIIDYFDLAFRDIKTIWSYLPSALGDFVISTANNVLKGIEDMVNEAIRRINDAISAIQNTPGVGQLAGVLGLGKIGRVDFGEGLPNPFVGSQDAMAGELATNRAEVYGTRAIDAIGNRAIEISQRPTEKQIKELERQRDAYADLIRTAEQRVGGLQMEADAMSMTQREADRMAFTQDLINSAANDNVPLTEKQIEKVRELGAAYADAMLQLEGARLDEQFRTPFRALQDELEQLAEFRDADAISWETYAAAVGESIGHMVTTVAGSLNALIDSFAMIADAQATRDQEELARRRAALDALGLEGDAKVAAEEALQKEVDRLGRESFERQKQISMARAVVAGAESVVNSFNAGTAIGGPPVGFAFAGVAAAAVAAQIAAIASTSYQSTSVPAAGSATAAPAAQAAQQQPTQMINVTLKGSGRGWTDDDLRELVESINGYTKNGSGTQIIVKAA